MQAQQIANRGLVFDDEYRFASRIAHMAILLPHSGLPPHFLRRLTTLPLSRS
jgi:hypothetical protein